MQHKTIAMSLVILVAAVVLLMSCQSTHYAVWEKMGKEKRHLLRDQVEKSRDDQQHVAADNA